MKTRLAVRPAWRKRAIPSASREVSGRTRSPDPRSASIMTRAQLRAQPRCYLVYVLVAIGSRNPLKLKTTELAFTRFRPNIKWVFQGSDVSSEVSSQPMSDDEALVGARNRACQAMDALNSDFGVGLEGGLQRIGGDWFNSGWVVVKHRTGAEGIGTTLRIMVPDYIMTYIHMGHELGTACDLVFRKSNSKQTQGYFGVMTNGLITRTSVFSDAIVAALSVFIHPGSVGKGPAADLDPAVRGEMLGLLGASGTATEFQNDPVGRPRLST
jgi:inosine/xanthosine triphosphatase